METHQHSCLENPTDRAAWRATVHRAAESDRTSQLSTHTQACIQVFNPTVLEGCDTFVSLALLNHPGGKLCLVWG